MPTTHSSDAGKSGDGTTERRQRAERHLWTLGGPDGHSRKREKSRARDHHRTKEHTQWSQGDNRPRRPHSHRGMGGSGESGVGSAGGWTDKDGEAALLCRGRSTRATSSCKPLLVPCSTLCTVNLIPGRTSKRGPLHACDMLIIPSVLSGHDYD